MISAKDELAHWAECISEEEAERLLVIARALDGANYEGNDFAAERGTGVVVVVAPFVYRAEELWAAYQARRIRSDPTVAPATAAVELLGKQVTRGFDNGTLTCTEMGQVVAEAVPAAGPPPTGTAPRRTIVRGDGRVVPVTVPDDDWPPVVSYEGRNYGATGKVGRAAAAPGEDMAEYDNGRGHRIWRTRDGRTIED
jgi:hypothetical protein